MRKNILTLLVIINCYFVIYSQEYVAIANTATNNLWGYINKKGEFILPPAYKYAYNFDETGLAPIYDALSNEVFYINLKGDTILQSNTQFELIKPKNQSLKRISEGTLVIKSESKYGIIDVKSKELIIKAKYDELSPLRDSCAIGKIDQNYYVINRNGTEILIDYPNIKEIHSFFDKRAIIQLNNGKTGYISTNGTIAIKPNFSDGFNFSNDCACVVDSSGLYGVIDTVGNWIIKPNFRQIYYFKKNENYTTAIDKFQRKVILSKDGEIKDLHEYLYVNRFSEGLAQTKVILDPKVKKRRDKDERYRNSGYIDTSGNLVIPPIFDNGRNFQNGLAVVRVGHLFGVIDKYGIWVIKPKFTQIGDFVKLDPIISEKKESIEPEFDYYDIGKFISIIDKLDYSKNSEINNKEWDDFYNLNIKFIYWLLTFRLDMNNFGLWQKAKEAFINTSNKEVIAKNDSETAKLLILAYLNKTPDLNNSYSYHEIETFLEKNKRLEVDTLREVWDIKQPHASLNQD